MVLYTAFYPDFPFMKVSSCGPFAAKLSQY